MTQFELMAIDEKPLLTPKPAQKWTRARIDRLRVIREQKKRQISLVKDADIFCRSILGKLQSAIRENPPSEKAARHIKNFELCGQKEMVLMCELCGTTKKIRNRCSLKWCPRCAQAVSFKRRELMTKLTAGCFGVKHVVLTQRNFYTDLVAEIGLARKRFAKILRQKIFSKVRGGCSSIELTNERKGWHLHFHLLMDAGFVDAKELSVAWGGLVGQDYAIVKVIPVEEKSYVQEVCKYVVSAQELAKWTGEQILQFIEALAGRQMFSTFGSFRGMKKIAKLAIEFEKLEEEPCACGCAQWIIGDDAAHCNRIIEARRR